MKPCTFATGRVRRDCDSPSRGRNIPTRARHKLPSRLLPKRQNGVTRYSLVDTATAPERRPGASVACGLSRRVGRSGRLRHPLSGARPAHPRRPLPLPLPRRAPDNGERRARRDAKRDVPPRRGAGIGDRGTRARATHEGTQTRPNPTSCHRPLILF